MWCCSKNHASPYSITPFYLDALHSFQILEKSIRRTNAKLSYTYILPNNTAMASFYKHYITVQGTILHSIIN